jgi:hypothetical protein
METRLHAGGVVVRQMGEGPVARPSCVLNGLVDAS